MNFYAAGPHSLRQNIIAFCVRPFASVSEMNRRILMIYQAVMSPDDDIWIIGDVVAAEPSEKTDQLSIILHSMSVRKRLIVKHRASKKTRHSLWTKVGRGETG